MIKRNLLFFVLLCLSMPTFSQATCSASFSAFTSFCPTIDFVDNSTSSPGQIIGWFWDFGDGTNSTSPFPIHTYTSQGTFIVCMTITTSDSCTSTDCDTLVINCPIPVCDAEFVANFGNCPTLAFTDTSTTNVGLVTSWAWNFGDGTTSTNQHPTHTYGANGSYIVCLDIQTNNGCSDTQCDTIVISCVGVTTCQAGFQWTFPPNGCPTVAFTDQAAAPGDTILTWFYDFGDGTTSSSASPTHTYTANGTYIVCQTITTNGSCTNTVCDTLAISCISASSCQAGFQFTMGNCPTLQFFDGSTSSPGSINSYNWSFGDGNNGTGQNPTHTYTANGTYVVCLTIGTTDSCSSTVCDTIMLNCIQPVSCQSAFQWSFGANGCPVVNFTDASTASPGSITSWSWNFGDGSSSSMQNPGHTYTANGVFNVCLTISTSDSCTSTFCDTVGINCIAGPTCLALFQYSSANDPTIDFTDASSASPGSISSWSWDFGDGGSSSMQNPSHTYAANGLYVVCLTIMTTDSCTSTYCDSIPVGSLAMEDVMASHALSISPNPFRDEVRISYQLMGSEDVRLEIFDLSGKQIAILENGSKSSGDYEISWNAEGLSNGLYFLRFTVGDHMGHAKLMLAR